MGGRSAEASNSSVFEVAAMTFWKYGGRAFEVGPKGRWGTGKKKNPFKPSKKDRVIRRKRKM